MVHHAHLGGLGRAQPAVVDHQLEAAAGHQAEGVLGAVVGLWPFQAPVPPVPGDTLQGILVTFENLGAFEVGKDLAVTPGEVIYQNDLIQLIQYTPTTRDVARRPMLIIPPWLNKYYVLDMQPEYSVVK